MRTLNTIYSVLLNDKENVGNFDAGQMRFPLSSPEVQRGDDSQRWPDGYAIGARLLATSLANGNTDFTSSRIVLHAAKPTEKSANLGIDILYSCCLAYELRHSTDSAAITRAINQLQGCITASHTFIVSQQTEMLASARQFINSMVLGWYALTFKDEQAADSYEKLLITAMDNLLEDDRVYEFRGYNEQPLNQTTGSVERSWLRADSWAITGLSYGLFILSRLARTTRLNDIEQRLDKLCRKALLLHASYGFFPAVYFNDMRYDEGDITDIPAQAAIYNALRFIERRYSSHSETRIRLAEVLKPFINQQLQDRAERPNGDAPPGHTQTISDSAAAGDYYLLRALWDARYQDNEPDINII